jgi:hypothetical protein
VCRKVCRESIRLYQIIYRSVLIQSGTHDLKFWMLILHCCFHAPMAHRSHDGCQIFPVLCKIRVV